MRYQEMEPGEKEASLHLSVWLLFCPLSLERPWTVKLCRRNVYHCRKACKKLDQDRIRHSRRKSQEESKGADNSETTRRVSLRHWRQEKVLPMKQEPSNVTRKELNKCLHFRVHFSRYLHFDCFSCLEM